MLVIDVFFLLHCTVIVHQNALTGAFQIIELAVVCGPPERGGNSQRDDDAQGNQQNQDFHGRRYLRARRSELTTTTSELVAMPIAAQAGEIFPIIASGTASAL